MEEIERTHRTRILHAFSGLSLGEVQLLLLGLWVIREEGRIDPRLDTEYGWLVDALTAHGLVVPMTGEGAGVPYIQEPLTPNTVTL